MQTLPTLNTGDCVEIIAPASRCSDKQLADLKELLTSWGLDCLIHPDIFGQDLLCANTDDIRFGSLERALLNPKTKAIICARGGYGSMRLIPYLSRLPAPSNPKLVVGMSDITALHLFLQQQWGWPTLHGALAVDKFSPESIEATRALLFGEAKEMVFEGIPFNSAARKNKWVKGSVTGGNLCLVQTSIGTAWQLNAGGKIILLEEVGERGYRIDRMLEHLRQANIFTNAAAIVFGDFTGGLETDGSSLIEPVLRRFAEQCEIPVIKINGIGHGPINFPIPLGTEAIIQASESIQLICSR